MARPETPNASGSAAAWCVLMWLDDLDTAFRHLDLYDRFGCPGGHVQATFRCLTRFGGQIDPKVAGHAQQPRPCLLDQSRRATAGGRGRRTGPADDRGQRRAGRPRAGRRTAPCGCRPLPRRTNNPASAAPGTIRNFRGLDRIAP